MSTAKPTNVRSQRLDLRALLLLGSMLLLFVLGVVLLWRSGVRNSREQALKQAKLLLEKKQPSLALSYLNQYLEKNPGNVEALGLKAKILAEGARDDVQVREAIRVYERILALSPAGPEGRNARKRLAELWLRIDQPAAAETAARDLVKQAGDDAEAHRLLAQALEGLAVRGDTKALEEARREFEAAERIKPGDVEGAELLAALYRDRLDDRAKAEAVLDRLVERNRDGAPEALAAAYLARSRHFASLKKKDRATEDVERALKADPKNPDVRLAAAESNLDRGDILSARRNLEALGPEGRSNLRVKVVEGLIDLAEQHPEEAIQSWRSGLLLSSGNDAGLTWQLAHLLLENNRPTEAEPLIKQYERLAGGKEPTPAARYLHAYWLLKTHRPTEAIAELSAIRYKASKELEPHLYLVLGQCYEANRDDAQALAAFRKAAERAGEWNAPWLAIARVQAAEHPAEAIGTLEQALVALPGDPKLLAMLATLRWRRQVQLPPEKRSWADVERTLEQARKAAPNSVELALVQADYLMTSGHPDEAIALLQSATKLNPKSVPVWSARANALSRSGRIPEALDVLEQAVAAAGPQASFYVTRTWLRYAQGHTGEARAALVEGLSRVGDDQKPSLWKAMGELQVAQKNYPEAKRAYEEWARLQPDEPEPRLSLFDLALNAGDEKEIRSEIEALKRIGGASSPYWRMARAQELMRSRPGSKGDDADRAARLKEAEGLVAEIEKSHPQWSLGFVLEGRLRERQGQTDKAIKAYERATELKGGQAALDPLVALLVREKRDEDLERLRRTVATLPRDFDRLAAVQALKLGDKGRAEQLAARFVEGDPQGLDGRVWQTQVLQALGKPKAAEEALRLLVRQRPEEPAPWVQLVMFLVNQKRISAAREAIEEMRAKVRIERPELLLAQCYRAVGDLKRANECYRDALKKAPGDLSVRLAAINYCEQVGQRPTAEALLRDTLKRDPALGWATRRLALSLAGHSGDRAAWDEAVRLIGPEAKPDDNPDDVLTRARVYAQGAEPGQRHKALEILKAYTAEVPSSAPAHELMARLLFAEGQRDEAVREAETAATGDAATTEAVLLYAGYLIAAHDLDKAQVQLDRLAAADPDGLPVAELRARILAAKGQGPEAAKGLEQAFDRVAGTPEELAVGEKMITLLTELEQLDAAERIARRLRKLGPRGACLLAEFLGKHGKLTEAAPILEEAASAGDARDAGAVALTLAANPKADASWLERADRFLSDARKAQPNSLDLLTLEGTLRHLQRRHEAEIAVYEAILERKPSNFMFLNNMAWTLSEEMGRPKEGLERIDQAIEHVGRRANLLDTRGVILLRLGRGEEALKDLEAAAEVLPSGSVDFHLARAYQKLGRTDALRKYRERARKNVEPARLEPSEKAAWDEMMKD